MPKPIYVGEFRLDERIASGGFADVWRGVHRRTLVPVAVKVLRDSADSSRLAAFRKEIRAVVSLDHPNILQITEAGVVSQLEATGVSGFSVNQPWFAMPLVSGGSLRAHIKEKGCAPAKWLLGIAHALAHAHARGVLHLDVKPSNVLLMADIGGTLPVLTDFGVAHFIGGASNGKAQAAGTPGYVAPEQLLGESLLVDGRTDLFALGMTAVEVLSGKKARPVRDVNELWNTVFSEDASKWVEFVPPAFRDWVAALTQSEITERPTSAAHAARELERILVNEDLLDTDERPARSSRAEDATERVFALTQTLLAVPASVTQRLVRTQRERNDLRNARDTSQTSGSRPMRVGVPLAPGPVPKSPERGALSTGTQSGAGVATLRSTTLVGRDKHAAWLWSEIVRLHDGPKPRLLHLHGPRDSGRTKMLRWVAENVMERSTAIPFVVGCREENPLNLALQERLNIAEPTSPFVGEACRRWLARVGAPNTEVARLLTGLVGDPDLQMTTPGALRVMTPAERWSAFETLVNHLSRHWPVVLLIDDAEHARNAEAARAAAMSAASDRVMTVVCSEIADLKGVVAESSHALEPLDDGAMEELLLSLAPFEPSSIRPLVRGARGLPGRLVHLVRHHIRRELVEEGPAGLVLRSFEPLPGYDSDQARLTEELERVDHLLATERARDAMKLAALLGSWFSPARWAGITAGSSDEERERVLTELARTGALVRRGRRWVWRSIEFQEVAARWCAQNADGRELLRHAAELLVRVEPPEPRSRLASADLFWEASLSREAFEARLEALELDLGSGQLRYADQILPLLQRMAPPTTTHAATLASMALMVETGRMLDPKELLERTQAVEASLSEDTPSLASGWFALVRAIAAVRGADFHAARHFLHKAGAVALSTANDALRRRVWATRADLTLRALDADEARELAAEIRDRLEAEPDLDERMELLTHAVAVARFTDDFDQSEVFGELIETGYAIGSTYRVAQADVFRGHQLVEAGDFEEGIAHLRRAHRLLMMANSRRTHMVQLNIIDALSRAGDFEAVAEEATRASEELERVGEKVPSHIASIYALEALARLGLWEELERRAPEDVREFVRLGFSEPSPMRPLTELLVVLDVEERDALIAKILPQIREFADRVGASPAHTTLSAIERRFAERQSE